MVNTFSLKRVSIVCVFISLFVIFCTGCKHDVTSESLFQNPSVAAYFCIPEKIESCLPLVIVNTSNGWRASYGGSASKSSIELRPRGQSDDDNALIFDEFVDGRKMGHYILPKYVEFDMLYYCNGDSKDTISFYATPLYDISVLNRENIDPEDDLYYDECKFDCQRALYHAYCNPSRSLKKGIEFCGNLDDFESVVSHDRKVRLSSAYYRTLGNGHGNLWQFIILQYRDGEGVSTLCNFIYPYFRDLLGDSLHMNYGHLNNFRIHQINLKGKDYYLIESTPFDEVVSPITKEGAFEYFTNYWCAVAAYKINKGKFCPAPILNGRNSCVVIADEVNEDMHFKVDAEHSVILVPHASTTDFQFSGDFDTIPLK